MEVLLTVGLYLLGLAGFVGIIIFGYFFIRWILYKRLPPGKKLMYDVQLIRKKLDRKLQPGEKAESVFDYLPLVEDETCRAELEELFRGYYRVRFRGDSANDELVESMRNMVRRIR